MVYVEPLVQLIGQAGRVLNEHLQRLLALEDFLPAIRRHDRHALYEAAMDDCVAELSNRPQRLCRC